MICRLYGTKTYLPHPNKQRLRGHTDILPDLSRTKDKILCPICSNEKMGVGGWVVMGVLCWKSLESWMTSHVLRRLHRLFWALGASLLWFFSVQNSTTWNCQYNDTHDSDVLLVKISNKITPRVPTASTPLLASNRGSESQLVSGTTRENESQVLFPPMSSASFTFSAAPQWTTVTPFTLQSFCPSSHHTLPLTVQSYLSIFRLPNSNSLPSASH